MKEYYIFYIKNIKNNRYYIGYSSKPTRKMTELFNRGVKGYGKKDNYMHRGLFIHMYKQGLQDFEFRIICECSQCELDETVKKHIFDYKAYKEGYNTYPSNKRDYSDKNMAIIYKQNAKMITNDDKEYFKTYIKSCTKSNSGEDKLQFFYYLLYNKKNKEIYIGKRKNTTLEKVLESMRKSVEGKKLRDYSSGMLNYKLLEHGIENFTIKLVKEYDTEEERELDYERIILAYGKKYRYLTPYLRDKHKEFKEG